MLLYDIRVPSARPLEGAGVLTASSTRGPPAPVDEAGGMGALAGGTFASISLNLLVASDWSMA